MVTQINSIIKNLLQLLHNITQLFETTLHFLPQEVTLLNSINTTNFQHNFNSGSKFKILKPTSSWLTFGISKFVSLSISHFFISFSSTFFYMVVSSIISAYCYLNCIKHNINCIKLNINTNRLI